MRILVVGAGAVGGYFGGRLAAARRDVTFLVRPGRARQIAATGGLIIKDPAGGVVVHEPVLVQADSLIGRYDVIFLSCKAYDLESCMADFATAVGPDTMILPGLNGMRHIETLSERFGAERVLGGRVRIFATLDDEGRVLHQAPMHVLDYGEVEGGISPRVEKLHKAMSGAGFDARASGDIMQDMWDKWAMIATLAGSTGLMRAPVGVIARSGGADFVRGLMNETLAIARHNGRPISDAFAADIVKVATDPASGQMASLAKDMIGGRRIEAEQIIGDLLARAPTGSGDDFIRLKTVHVHLKCYEAGLKSQNPLTLDDGIGSKESVRK